MNQSDALAFCDHWLAAWTGNQPDILIQYYSDDTYYQDPSKQEGIHGKEKLFNYFKKLLAKYPDCAWSAVEIFPTEQGFILKWQAKNVATVFSGLDIVEIKDNKIIRNEVYFDPRQLIDS